jgi:hypothetical protein
MAINGTTPLILVQKYTYTDTEHGLKDLSLSELYDMKKYTYLEKNKSGLPIPFILSEDTGFLSVKEQTKLMSNVDYKNDFVFVSQRGNSLILDIEAKRNSPIVIAFLNLIQLFWNNIQMYKYTISYFNDGIISMNAYLGGLNISSIVGKDLYNITLVLDSGKAPFDLKSDDEKITATAGIVLSRIIGNII